MNHIYRVVYNSATNTYQAVPENSTGKHKTASEKSSCAVSDVSEKGAFFSLKPMALCAMAMGLSSTGAWAAPTGGHISAGDASIAQHGKITNIQQNSQKAAINWQSFGIKADETVNFKQPNAQAVILNRVIGNEKSVIDGAMNANGKVFISNPNGMIIGKNAQINVGALLATTAKIKDQDFMNGFFKFDEATGDITHLGDIKVPTGGVVALIAPIVANKGNITAPQGKVLLASAEQFSITLPDNGQFAYTLDRGTLQGLVDNGGAILADGGHVILTAKGTDAVKKSLIKHSGNIEANTVQNKNGVIELLGDLDNTRLEASGSLKAEAEQGDGGFVETSAAKLSINDLKVSTKSKFGKTGLWVIDPKDLIVAPSGGDTTGAQVSASLQHTDIQLKSKDGATEGKGDVIINDEISWDKNTLTLNAENNIYINENLNGSGNARLELKYGQATPDGIQADGSESDYYFYRYLNENKVINLPAGASLTTQRGSSPDNLRRFQVVHADRLDGRLLPPNVAIGEDIDLSGQILTQGLNGVKLLHGLGHKINGLTIEHAQNIESNNNSPQHIGFINELKEGGIRDLTLNNVNIKTKINDNCGGNCDIPVGVSALVGYAQDVTIKNVDVSGEITHTGDYRNIVKQNDWVGLEGERVYYKPEQPTNTITVSSQPVVPTQPPVSQPPVSQPPVSQPPVSQPPVSQPPVSQPPVSQPPVSQPPVSQPPVSQPPVSQPPVSQPPVSQPPVSQPPVSQPPVSQPPVSQPPVSQPPVSQPPVSQPPVSQSSMTNVPNNVLTPILNPFNPACWVNGTCNNKLPDINQLQPPVSMPVSSTPTETEKDKQPVNNTQAKPADNQTAATQTAEKPVVYSGPYDDKKYEALSRILFKNGYGAKHDKGYVGQLAYPGSRFGLDPKFDKEAAAAYGKAERHNFAEIYHAGIDYRANGGTPVFSPVDGKVVNITQCNGGYKCGIFIRDNDTGHLVILYHTSTKDSSNGKRKGSYIKIGDTVRKGDWVTSVVEHSNAHLHVEVRKKEYQGLSASDVFGDVIGAHRAAVTREKLKTEFYVLNPLEILIK